MEVGGSVMAGNPCKWGMAEWSAGGTPRDDTDFFGDQVPVVREAYSS